MGDADALEHARCLDGVHLRCKHGEVFNAHSFFFLTGRDQRSRTMASEAQSCGARDAVRNAGLPLLSISESRIVSSKFTAI